MLDILNKIDSFVWGPPLLVLLVGTGILLTFRLKLLQLLRLPLAIKLILFAKNDGDGDVNSFKALCTALAATVGTGNIVGVATALKAGGPGALFWMWMAAFFGMATKYAECLLAVKYREVDENGDIAGGPMFYIENGLGKKYRVLAVMFAFFGVFAACFGIGSFPLVTSIIDIVHITLDTNVVMTSVVLTVIVAFVTFGGLKPIASVSSTVVPLMAVVYFVCTVSILFMNSDKLLDTISLVFHCAFNTTAATGGFLGATVAGALRSGVARGVFSNESGLGSAPIVAAAAKTKWPAEQGLISMTGTFIDTIIICTLTGLSLIVTGFWNSEVQGAAMTSACFTHSFGVYGKYILMISLVLFAFTSILGWNYYGERCAVYLWGTKIIKPFRVAFILIIACAPFLKLEEVWALADIANGLMALPNLLALILLSGIVVKETEKYLDHVKKDGL